MSYETSSEFQIRYLLKSVAVYLLFMRRIASISMLAVVLYYLILTVLCFRKLLPRLFL